MADPLIPPQPSPPPKGTAAHPTEVASRPGAPERVGPYRVIRELGAGTRSIVYVADDPPQRRQVALRVIRPDGATWPRWRERLLREARIAGTLEHRHVARVYNAAEADGCLFLAMELLEGESLASRLKRSGRLPVAEAAGIARDVALGLAVAHARGLVHRDVTPGNIFLARTKEGADPGLPAALCVKLLDFGLVPDPSEVGMSTDDGAVCGTPGYLSPEQAAGEPATSASDLFNLGCVLYEMLTGRQPFRGKTTRDVLYETLREEPPPVQALNSAVPASLDELVHLLLTKDPSGRPPSARCVADELAAFAGPVTLCDDSPAEVLPPSPEPARQNWLPYLIAGGLLILVALVLALWPRSE